MATACRFFSLSFITSVCIIHVMGIFNLLLIIRVAVCLPHTTNREEDGKCQGLY